MIGANAKAIDKAEDRNLFKTTMEQIGLECCRASRSASLDEARGGHEIGLPW